MVPRYDTENVPWGTLRTRRGHAIHMRFKPRFSLIAGLALTALAAVPCLSAQPIALSLDDALQRAHAHSPSARAADARVRAASARVRAASALPSTNLSLGHGWGGETGGLDEDILVSQPLELPFKVAPRVHAAQRERDAARSLQLGASQDLDLAVSTAYYEALASDAASQLASDALKTATAFADAARIQFDAGDAAKSNVIRAGVETARAQQAFDAAAAERENRYASLRSLAGLPADNGVTLTDALAFVPISFAAASLEEAALKNRPDLLAARHNVSGSRAALSAVRLEPLPNLVVEERHSTINPRHGASSLRIGVSFPILDLGRNRADTASAKAMMAEQQANLDETTRAALLDVETAARTREVARKAVESFRAGRLGNAKELLNMAQIGFEHGATSYLELLDAQHIYLAEQTDYARALTDHSIAVAALRRAVGGTLP